MLKFLYKNIKKIIIEISDYQIKKTGARREKKAEEASEGQRGQGRGHGGRGKGDHTVKKGRTATSEQIIAPDIFTWEGS